MRLSENVGIVNVLKPGDHTAGVDGDSINMRDYKHCAFLVSAATVTGNPCLSLYSGATAGTKTTLISAAKYRIADAVQGAAGADNFASETAVHGATTGLPFVGATFSNKMTVIELDATALAADEPWLTLNIEKGTSSAANLAISAILLGPRYIANDMPTAIT